MSLNFDPRIFRDEVGWNIKTRWGEKPDRKKERGRLTHDSTIGRRTKSKVRTHIPLPHPPKLLLQLDIPDAQRASPRLPPRQPAPLPRDLLPGSSLALHSEHHLIGLGGFGEGARDREHVFAVFGGGGAFRCGGGGGGGSGFWGGFAGFGRGSCLGASLLLEVGGWRGGVVFVFVTVIVVAVVVVVFFFGGRRGRSRRRGGEGVGADDEAGFLLRRACRSTSTRNWGLIDMISVVVVIIIVIIIVIIKIVDVFVETAGIVQFSLLAIRVDAKIGEFLLCHCMLCQLFRPRTRFCDDRKVLKIVVVFIVIVIVIVELAAPRNVVIASGVAMIGAASVTPCRWLAESDTFPFSLTFL